MEKRGRFNDFEYHKIYWPKWAHFANIFREDSIIQLRIDGIHQYLYESAINNLIKNYKRLLE